MRIPNSIAIGNGKGGVGKTSTVAALAAGFANENRPVVVVDLDPQSNIASEYGVEEHDDGLGLLGAVLGAGTVTLQPTKRPHLSFVAAGEHTAKLSNYATVNWPDVAEFGDAIAAALQPHLTSDTWVFIDTPPSAGSNLADAALAIAQYLIVPTRIDKHSIDGMSTLLQRAIDVAKDREPIKPVGVVLFDVNLQATSILEEVRTELEDQLGDGFPLLQAMIRHAYKAAYDTKGIGLLPGEYAVIAAQHTVPWYEQIDKPASQRIAFATNAAPLAADYHALLEEVALRVGA